ncbi:hypothetical protein Q5O89_17165 [Peribacillus frigoritolerans]|nr:hypothetical protein [Peribacillus frigoritolerans]
MVGLLLTCLSVIAYNYFESDKTEKGKNPETKESKIAEVEEYGGTHLKKSAIRFTIKIGEPSHY